MIEYKARKFNGDHERKYTQNKKHEKYTEAS